jgi:hypothetical protein
MELVTLIGRDEIWILLSVADSAQCALSVCEVAVDIANVNDQRIAGDFFGGSRWDVHLRISCFSVSEGIFVVELSHLSNIGETEDTISGIDINDTESPIAEIEHVWDSYIARSGVISKRM